MYAHEREFMWNRSHYTLVSNYVYLNSSAVISNGIVTEIYFLYGCQKLLKMKYTCTGEYLQGVSLLSSKDNGKTNQGPQLHMYVKDHLKTANPF